MILPDASHERCSKVDEEYWEEMAIVNLVDYNGKHEVKPLVYNHLKKKKREGSRMAKQWCSHCADECETVRDKRMISCKNCGAVLDPNSHSQRKIRTNQLFILLMQTARMRSRRAPDQ